MNNRMKFATGLLSILPVISQASAQQHPATLERMVLEGALTEKMAKSDLGWQTHNERIGKTEFYIYTEEDGTQGTVCIRDGKEFFRKECTPEIVDTIRRIYAPRNTENSYSFNSDLSEKDIEKIRIWNSEIKDLGWKQSDQIVDQAIESLKLSKSPSEFLQAIDLLTREPNKDECVGSAIWYIANIRGSKPKEGESEPFIWYSTNERGMGFRTLDVKTNEITYVPDLDVFDAAAFSENIIYALKARNELPWGKNVSQEEFLQYVLPARTTQEPLGEFRRRLYESLSPVLRDKESPEEALKFVNELVNKMTRFESTPFEDQSALVRLMTHGDRCEGLTNMVIEFAKCGGGIPAFHVSTPAWSDGNNNHTWTGISSQDDKGDKRIFSINSGMPSDKDPDAYYDCVAAKIYARSPFGHVADVTKDFTVAGPVLIDEKKFQHKDRESNRAYLSVINYGIPVTVAETSLSNDAPLSFKDVGHKRETVYTISTNRSNWIYPRALDEVVAPIVLNSDGSITYLNEKHNSKSKKYDLGQEQIGRNIEPEKTYVLRSWDGGSFKENGEFYSERIDGATCILPSVPLSENVLYTIIEKGNSLTDSKDLTPPKGLEMYETRPFTVRKEKVRKH